MPTGKYDDALWALVRAGEWHEIHDYMPRQPFDEFPLYSRYDQIDFLKDLSAEEISEILIRFSLEFLVGEVEQRTTNPCCSW